MAAINVLVGLTPASAAVVVMLTGIAELFYFFFQRPESHRRHHELGVHRGNYSDLPVWDLIFGRFDNPREVPRTCGFGEQRERQLLRMLIGGTSK